jgi:L-seryl-tRNA(Ser) seleniumtransferase
LSELPYVRGEILASTEDDFAKLRRAWTIVARRHAEGSLFDFTGLERSLGATPTSVLDDELAGALYFERLSELALEHLGGDARRDEVMVTNRLTAAIVVAMQVLVRPGATVVGVSAGYSHPAVVRAVRLAGGRLVDTVGLCALAQALEPEDVCAVVLTRLAVTYEALPGEEVARAVELAHERGVPVFVDDAGGARVAPAVLGQPRTLELGAEVGATGLDKYGTTGPRLGLLAGRADLVRPMRARAIELGLDARPLLYPAVVRSLEQYRPERVRELVRTTEEVARALADRLGAWVEQSPFAARLPGEGILAEAARRGGVEAPPVAPVEATAALAMLLLEEHGILTVHFAAVPPGTSALLVKFVPPERLRRFGGAGAFADAVDASLDRLASLLREPAELRKLLGAS